MNMSPAQKCRALDLHPLPGPGGVLGSGWPDFEETERELGARAAYCLEAERLDPADWALNLSYAAYITGMTQEELLTRSGQARLREFSERS